MTDFYFAMWDNFRAMTETITTPTKPIRLTSLATCAGCAAKLKAETLAELLVPIQGLFDPISSPDLLVGLGQPDDAAVWRLDEDRALVVTTDFFTPVVDDPYDFGAIAAANALSDVYAMGGKPFLALNIATLPNDLPTEIGAAIFRGGAEKAKEAGVVVAGGHTIQDKEPKYGLVAIGFVDPRKAISKQGARVGDKLFLTKPLGFGVTNTAVKRELTSPLEDGEVVVWMKRLNKVASELAIEFGLRGGTDITGFGLLGHGWEMACVGKAPTRWRTEKEEARSPREREEHFFAPLRKEAAPLKTAGGIRLRFYFDAIPFTSAARKFAEQGTFPGGSLDNRNRIPPA
ncbi:MAG: selenide, water dikinase SelD, partial [Chloroflexi bacterium]|nr:selenide, water dikinase SelD [Chloroflexota bacterium]